MKNARSKPSITAKRLAQMASVVGRSFTAADVAVIDGRAEEALDSDLQRIIDRELEVIGDIQRSLLPAELPAIPTMGLAAHYDTSKSAGGDERHSWQPS